MGAPWTTYDETHEHTEWGPRNLLVEWELKNTPIDKTSEWALLSLSLSIGKGGWSDGRFISFSGNNRPLDMKDEQ